MFSPAVAAQSISVEQIALTSLQRFTESPVEYSQGNPKSTDITRTLPVMAIKCRLTGSYTVATSASTLKSYGVLNLIKRLQLIVDGDTELINVPGFMLGTISHLYSGNATVLTQPSVSVGTTSFEASFTIPVDPGAYYALLDASRRERLTLNVQWGQPQDIATPGGTHSVSAVQLNVQTLGIAGAPVGQPGGVRFPYLQHRIISLDTPITAAQTDLEFKLNSRRQYSGIYLFSFSDGVASNAILNSATLKIANNTIQKQLRADIESENFEQYGLSSKFTGIHAFDFVKKSNVDHMVITTGSTEPRLSLDVNKPGTSDTIHIVTDYYVPPVAA